MVVPSDLLSKNLVQMMCEYCLQLKSNVYHKISTEPQGSCFFVRQKRGLRTQGRGGELNYDHNIFTNEAKRNMFFTAYFQDLFVSGKEHF